jgi:hypothetical protein
MNMTDAEERFAFAFMAMCSFVWEHRRYERHEVFTIDNVESARYLVQFGLVGPRNLPLDEPA